jgi:hypothetical protein
MEQSEIERLIGELELAVDRLRSLYEQYFMGIEKLEPMVPRKDVDRRIHVLRKEQIRNTALRFRFQMLLQRYNTFQTYWQRICRDIENGTYKRHVIRARQRFGGKRPSVAPPADAPRVDPSFAAELAELDREFAPAETLADSDVEWAEEGPTTVRSDEGEPPGGPRPHPSTRTPRHPPAPRAPPPRSPRPPPPSSSRIPAPPSSRNPIPSARSSAGPSSSSRPAPSSSSRSAAPSSTRAAAPSSSRHPASPRTPRTPSAPRADSRQGAPPPAAPPRPPAPGGRAGASPPPPRSSGSSAAVPRREADLPEDRVRQLYHQYIETKRRQNESTAAITYDAVARSLRESSAKLKQKLGRPIDFEVAVKDGRAILRPVLK